MCGFAGYIDLRRERFAEKEILSRMIGTMTHRGPDSAGYFVEDHVGLGFRRLSIIDLDGGDQPIYNEDRSLVLMCNGEIFNYRSLKDDLIKKGHTFYTNSDVEVLLHMYEEEGADFVRRLNGQFAFVIYDRKQKKLLLARDHFGIVPLFYTIVDGVLIFASEIKAILEHPLAPREVDLTGLDQILSFPGLVSPRTMFAGIESLKCGHQLLVNDSNIRVTEYWDLNYPHADEYIDGKPEEYYVDTLDELLTRSIKYRLQSDVPVGFYLSGGLDSSLIAAMIKDHSSFSAGNSFSIGFSDENKEISERKYQQMMVEQVESNHHEIVFDWMEISDRLSDMIYHCECPVRESYNTCSMALSESTKKAGITVILTGEGSDELFAGYIGYRFDQTGLRDDRAYDLDTIMEDELREKLWGDKDIFYEKNQLELREIKGALYSCQVNEIWGEFDCLNYELINKERLQGRHPIHQRSYLDFKLRLADHLLSDHGDRMALANSVEARFPFLDVDLVEFATKIPPELKVKGLSEKYILKRVAENKVPQEIIDREKFGFRAPGSPFLLRQNIEWVNDLLSYNQIKRQGYFNPDVIENLKSQYSEDGYKINPHLEDDLLMVVLTFGILLDRFDLPGLN